MAIYGREGASQDPVAVHYELRDLWRHVPITGEILTKWAPSISVLLGRESFDEGAVALSRLKAIAALYSDDRDVAALLAAYAWGEAEVLASDVDQRLSDFAHEHGRSARSARRWAERGAGKIALFVLEEADVPDEFLDVEFRWSEATNRFSLTIFCVTQSATIVSIRLGKVAVATCVFEQAPDSNEGGFDSIDLSWLPIDRNIEIRWDRSLVLNLIMAKNNVKATTVHTDRGLYVTLYEPRKAFFD